VAAIRRRRLTWQLGEVTGVAWETLRAKRLFREVPSWEGHRAGQHVDLRLTAEDGYQAQRSYPIASAPEEDERIELLVERLEDGEVSSYLTDELRVGDRLELRGSIGGGSPGKPGRVVRSCSWLEVQA
jgi:ferredoxin-NADP reductase